MMVYPLSMTFESTFEVEFELSTPEFFLFEDFKYKYQNLHLLSNIGSLSLVDSKDINWKFAVQWGEVSDDTDPVNAKDDAGNFSLPLKFDAKITYTVVYGSDPIERIAAVMHNVENKI